MSPKLLTLGNFALSSVFQDGKLVARKNFCGTNFRVILAAAILGTPADYVAAIGPEKTWREILNKFEQFKIMPAKVIPLEESIEFNWYYQDSYLENLESKNLKKMDLIAQAVNDGSINIQQYPYVNICPLGYQNEKSILDKLDPENQTVFYIFHYSNLDFADPKKYLQLFSSVNFLFLNHHEARLLTGEDDLKESGKILSQYAQTCFISVEDKGLMVFQHDDALHVPTFSVQAVTPGGAGDILAGAIIACLIKGEKLAVAARIGELLASISTTDYLTNNLIKLL